MPLSEPDDDVALAMALRAQATARTLSNFPPSPLQPALAKCHVALHDLSLARVEAAALAKTSCPSLRSSGPKAPPPPLPSLRSNWPKAPPPPPPLSKAPAILVRNYVRPAVIPLRGGPPDDSEASPVQCEHFEQTWLRLVHIVFLKVDLLQILRAWRNLDRSRATDSGLSPNWCPQRGKILPIDLDYVLKAATSSMSEARFAGAIPMLSCCAKFMLARLLGIGTISRGDFQERSKIMMEMGRRCAAMLRHCIAALPAKQKTSLRQEHLLKLLLAQHVLKPLTLLNLPRRLVWEFLRDPYELLVYSKDASVHAISLESGNLLEMWASCPEKRLAVKIALRGNEFAHCSLPVDEDSEMLLEQDACGWCLRLAREGKCSHLQPELAWVQQHGRTHLRINEEGAQYERDGVVVASKTGTEMIYHAGAVAYSSKGSLFAALVFRPLSLYPQSILAFDLNTGDSTSLPVKLSDFAWADSQLEVPLQIHQGIILYGSRWGVVPYEKLVCHEALAYRELRGTAAGVRLRQLVTGFAFETNVLAVISGSCSDSIGELNVYHFLSNVGFDNDTPALSVYGAFSNVALAGAHVITVQGPESNIVQVWPICGPAHCLLTISFDSPVECIAAMPHARMRLSCFDAQPFQKKVLQRGLQPRSALDLSKQQPRAVEKVAVAVASETAEAVREKEKMDPDLESAILRSVQESQEQENAHLSEAIMRSKVEAPISDDEIVVMRLKRLGCVAEVNSALLASPHLADARARVEEAGCKVLPEWTPAKLLVPLTQEQVAEEGIELRAHHIVGLSGDFNNVVAALKDLPRRRRPTISSPASACDQISQQKALALEELPVEFEIEVQQTFVHFSIPKDVSEASCATASAPCGDMTGKQPPNPRHWKQ